MTQWSTPPPVARWLLECALPTDVRESIIGDLDEVFQRDCRRNGLPSARRCYWRQAISFTMHFVVERWRDRRRGGVMRMGLSWLDFKLGFRMLARYPMLTVVGSLAMAVAIAVGAGTFEIIMRLTNPSLPLPNGDRIVGLNYWDRTEPGIRAPSSYDVLTWREGLRNVEDIGAFRLVQRNLIVDGQVGEPVDAAEISAAAFRVTGVPPLMGRVLVDADESPGSPAVVVLGNRLWKTRFGADPAVIGRVVRLGATQATVVGIMPEGFAFPVRQSLWTALSVSEFAQEPGRDQPLRVFGRLATGVELQEAQAELTTFGSRVAERFTKEYEHLQPQVLPYAESFIEMPQDFLVRAGVHSINAFGALFLVVICGNVALLMFARAATREREILVRRALGAARKRIVMQLFTEALVLAAIAAVLGLTATDFALRWTLAALSTEAEGWPFWFEGGISATTVTYSALLTLLAAVVAGVVPALKITRTNMEVGLRQASAGAGGIRMGGIWTGVIVAQIAATVLFTAVAYVAQRQAAGIASAKAAFPAEKYVAMRLEMDRDGLTEERASTVDEAFLRRYEATARELEQRIAAEANVAGVTLAERLPLMASDGGVFELDDAGPSESVTGREHFATRTAVDLDFFNVFQTPVVAGRGFAPHDMAVGTNTVVVNHLFVDKILAGRNAVGRRIRYRVEDSQVIKEPGPWFEIIGVVRDLVPDPEAPMNLDNPAKPVVYHTLGSNQTQSSGGTTRTFGRPSYPLYLATHVRSGDPTSVLPTLRRIAADISPELRLSDIQRLDQGTSSDARAWNGMANVILLMSAIALVLSLAGVYAITSFTVSRRTREIAVRVALGAQISNVVTIVFRGPFFQVAMGVAVGCLIMGGLVALSLRNSDVGVGTVTRHASLLLGYGTIMMSICGLACIGPLLRLFRVEPADVLRDDA
jgi:putative ABC transport system permease protein